MSKRNPAQDYANEAGRRLDAIGLSTEEQIAANENMPTRSAIYHEMGKLEPIEFGAPGELSLHEIIERGNCEGYCDVRLDRPLSASIRFIEQRLHYNNVDKLGAFAEAYERAWKDGAK
jgi:hypothetical protein